MTEHAKPSGSPDPASHRRRVYEAPAIVDSTAFETLALSCAKTEFSVCDPNFGGPGPINNS